MKKQNKTGNLTFFTLLKKKSFFEGEGGGASFGGHFLTGHNNFNTKKINKNPS